MYRLHLDVPCGTDQKEAIRVAKLIIEDFKRGLAESTAAFDPFFNNNSIEIGVRLGNDEDRGTSNYLEFTSSGHCLNRKIKIKL